MTRTRLVGLLFCALPSVSLAFEAIDTLPYTPTGRFPAYDAAPEQPFALWVQGGTMYDTNVFRQSTAEQSEQIYRFGGGIRQDLRLVGRQRVRLQGEANAMRYSTFGELDHVAYGLLGEWLWEAGNDLAGTAGYTRRHYQASLAEVARGIRDLITEDRLYLTGGYQLDARTRIRGGVDHARVHRPRRAFAEIRTTGATAGADYVSPLGNTIGVEGRLARGDAPVPEIVAAAPGGIAQNDYDFREAALVATYAVGPMLRTAGRLGRTRISYSDLPGRDFNGSSARGRVEWLPGTKTILSLEGYHEPRTIIDVAATHVVVKGLAFGAEWAPTAKLVLAARFLHEDRDFEGDPAVATGGPLRLDTIRTIRVGTGWEITRRVNLGFAIDRGINDSSVLGRNYQFTALVANARYNF
ncbi:MAG: hypothetical protein ACT4P4_03485 [Betaproteobacteria bacterium]